MANTGKGASFFKEVLFKEEPEESLKITDEEFQEMYPEYNTSAINRAGATNDASTTYAEGRGLYLYIEHLPSRRTLSFKGFITEYSDNFTSNWNSESVYGRMDDIHTFQNTTRQINLGFVVPAYDVTDARCNLSKVTALARKLYPYYAGAQNDNVSTIARAPLLRLGFVNLIRDGRNGGGRLLGKMNGFSFTPNFDDGVFDFNGFIYPKTINISFTYDVLHEHVMGWTDTDDNDIEWSKGTAGAFPYSRPSIPEPANSPTDDQGATTADDEANTNGILG
tara:strand:- start:4819 stop:5655 length:837 start_codon:yes stop_codon:yes gene_type:complete